MSAIDAISLVRRSLMPYFLHDGWFLTMSFHHLVGHFIQHCPTNGDPNYDIKRVKPPTGIPKSMLIATPDGSYALPSGAVAVMKPNE